MRIIAGQLKGLNFNAPKGAKTHPMSDKVRGGLFNALGDIEGLDILDAFSGSGALSFEAISRGAYTCTAVEADIKAYRVTKENIRLLKLERKVKVSNAYLKSWLNTNTGKTFDIVLADPPYNDLNVPSLIRLVEHIKPKGILVLSWPGDQETLELHGMVNIKNKVYGDAQLVFYRKIS